MKQEFKRAIEELELKVLCCEICDKINANAIYHALHRAGIYTIDDLREHDFGTRPRILNLGEMRLEFIKEMKMIIEDEEKIQNIFSKDDDITKLRNDADRLYEQARKLRYEEGRAFSTTARLLGISKEALYLLIR